MIIRFHQVAQVLIGFFESFKSDQFSFENLTIR